MRIAIPSAGRVSAILQVPPRAHGLYVLAHGAGAGMHHPFMKRVADLLAERRVGTLRYQFLYMEEEKRRPDPPHLAQAAVRAAVAAAVEAAPKLPILAGGKSFGGRMTSQAQAEEPMDGVVGLIFLGFPLHAPGRRSDQRAAHLADVKIPMLFLQGTRDTLADLSLITGVTKKLGKRATLHVVDGGDHSFKVRKKDGRDQDAVMEEIGDAIAEWLEKTVKDGKRR